VALTAVTRVEVLF